MIAELVTTAAGIVTAGALARSAWVAWSAAPAGRLAEDPRLRPGWRSWRVDDGVWLVWDGALEDKLFPDEHPGAGAYNRLRLPFEVSCSTYVAGVLEEVAGGPLAVLGDGMKVEPRPPCSYPNCPERCPGQESEGFTIEQSIGTVLTEVARCGIGRRIP